jgi:ribosomal-protein-serine acetyltransferase
VVNGQCQDAGVLDTDVGIQTGLPRQVVLRALTTRDVVAFADHVAGDLPRLREHLPWPELTSTPDGATGWLGPYERREDGRVVAVGVWAGDDLVGGGVLFHHEPELAVVEVGCWLTAVAEGGGVAAATCRVLVGLARSELAAERVEWHASTLNVRSRRLAERLGFRYEGTLRSNYVLRGERLDTDLLSLVGAELDPFVTSGPAAPDR